MEKNIIVVNNELLASSLFHFYEDSEMERLLLVKKIDDDKFEVIARCEGGCDYQELNLEDTADMLDYWSAKVDTIVIGDKVKEVKDVGLRFLR